MRGSSAHAAAAGGTTAPPAQQQADQDLTEIDLRCPQCQELFTVQDTGQRPLEIDCPHCGAHGQVDLPEREEPEAETSAEEEPAEAHAAAATSLADEPIEEESAGENPVISLKCPACSTQFDVEDTGERPLQMTCPGCGRSGKLR